MRNLGAKRGEPPLRNMKNLSLGLESWETDGYLVMMIRRPASIHRPLHQQHSQKMRQQQQRLRVTRCTLRNVVMWAATWWWRHAWHGVPPTKEVHPFSALPRRFQSPEWQTEPEHRLPIPRCNVMHRFQILKPMSSESLDALGLARVPLSKSITDPNSSSTSVSLWWRKTIVVMS